MSDYSLTSPYGWYGENLLAYLVLVPEREVLETLPGTGRPSESNGARLRIVEAMREICPGICHGDIAPEVFDCFQRMFPILPEDRRFLARGHMFALLEPAPA